MLLLVRLYIIYHLVITTTMMFDTLKSPLLPTPDPIYCRATQNEILVCDPDAVLNNEQIVTLEKGIMKIYNETHSNCNNSNNQTEGFRVRLFIHQRYNETVLPVTFSSQTKRHEKMRAYAGFLQKQYSPEHHCDDTSLLFISKEDKAVLIVVGWAAEPFLSAEVRQYIRRQLSRRLGRGDIAGAAKDGLKIVEDAFKFGAEYVLHASTRRHQKVTVTVVVVSCVLIITVVVLVCFVIKWRRRRKRFIPETEETDDDDDVNEESFQFPL